MATKFFDKISWPKLVLLLVVILIVTRVVAPDAAQWILSPIVELARAGIQAVRDLGGT
jgi:hypothetical protein